MISSHLRTRLRRDFAALVDARREADADVARDVAHDRRQRARRGRRRGRTPSPRKFDRHDLNDTGWRIEQAEWRRRARRPRARSARRARTRRRRASRAYHVKQKPEDSDTTDAAGVRLGARWRAVDAAGHLRPRRPRGLSQLGADERDPRQGRRRRAAGDGHADPGRRDQPAGARRRAYRRASTRSGAIGGAQAIAALAYGTGRIAPVDVVTGPGNAWVAEAKRQLYGVVGIDMVAGPSEIVVVADGAERPDWIAADLLSQAEHDPSSQSILFTDDAAFADAVADAVDRQIGDARDRARSRAQAGTRTARSSSSPSLAEAMPLVDRLAPEHLELAVRRSAGAVRPGPPRRHRCSSAATRPRRSAITSPGPTTSSPPAAARASPVGPVGARFHEAHELPRTSTRPRSRHRPGGGGAGRGRGAARARADRWRSGCA